MGDPQQLHCFFWGTSWNIHRWMMNGGTPIYGNHHMSHKPKPITVTITCRFGHMYDPSCPSKNSAANFLGKIRRQCGCDLSHRISTLATCHPLSSDMQAAVPSENPQNDSFELTWNVQSQSSSYDQWPVHQWPCVTSSCEGSVNMDDKHKLKRKLSHYLIMGREKT